MIVVLELESLTDAAVAVYHPLCGTVMSSHAKLGETAGCGKIPEPENFVPL